MRILIILLTFYLAFSSYSSELSYANFDGPNCINAAMVKAYLLAFHPYSSNQELWNKLHSIQCNSVDKNSLRNGDIGIIIDRGVHALPDIISHAFIYLDVYSSYEKHGWAKSEAYQVVDTKSILDEYSVSEDSRVYVEYYRCIPQHDFLLSNRSKIHPKILKIYNDLMILEFKHNQLAKNIFSDKSSLISFFKLIKKEITLLNVDELSSIDHLIFEDINNRLESLSSSALIDFRASSSALNKSAGT
jgi:hypothetical protein